jgi:NADH:ubiquinone oxidoreductase subunit
MVKSAEQKLKQKEYFKQYYESHKEKFYDFNKRRYETTKHCDACDKDVSLRYWLRHTRKERHIKNADLKLKDPDYVPPNKNVPKGKIIDELSEEVANLKQQLREIKAL